MFDNLDPATKQYWIFAIVVSIIISGLINFFAVELLKGSFLYGFPVNLATATGIGSFLGRLINSVVIGLILSPIMYYFIKYMQTRIR